jgi:hypothetical protein
LSFLPFLSFLDDFSLVLSPLSFLPFLSFLSPLSFLDDFSLVASPLSFLDDFFEDASDFLAFFSDLRLSLSSFNLGVTLSSFCFSNHVCCESTCSRCLGRNHRREILCFYEKRQCEETPER